MSELMIERPQGQRAAAEEWYQFDDIAAGIVVPEGLRIPEALRSKPFVVGYVEEGDVGNQWGHLCRRHESRIFTKEFGVDHRVVMPSEYRDYERRSSFLYLADQQTSTLEGCIRTIRGSLPEHLKTFRDTVLPQIPYAQEDAFSYIRDFHPECSRMEEVLDIATLAVTEKYRTARLATDDDVPFRVGFTLYHGVYEYSLNQGIKGWVMVLDKRARRVLEFVGFRFEALCGQKEPIKYMGSTAYPLYVSVADIPVSLKSKNPLYEQIICHGLGISDFCEIGN